MLGGGGRFKGIKEESIVGSDIRRDRLDEATQASKEKSVAGSFVAC